MPIEKLRTGGTAPALNNEEACRIVPSPPRVTTKSIFSELGPDYCRGSDSEQRGTGKRLTGLPDFSPTRYIFSVFMKYMDSRISSMHMSGLHQRK